MTIYDKLTQAIVLHKLTSTKNYNLKDCFEYIPKNNTVLFLYNEDLNRNKKNLKDRNTGLYIDDNKDTETFIANNTKSLAKSVAEVKTSPVTIFLPIANNETEINDYLEFITAVINAIFDIGCVPPIWKNVIIAIASIENLMIKIYFNRF
jgi:hypothetical protein